MLRQAAKVLSVKAIDCSRPPPACGDPFPSQDRNAAAARLYGEAFAAKDARAVALLRQAQKAGFFKQPANIAHMKTDSDLRVLRARPDCRDLLQGLETPAKP